MVGLGLMIRRAIVSSPVALCCENLGHTQRQKIASKLAMALFEFFVMYVVHGSNKPLCSLSDYMSFVSLGPVKR